MGIKTKVLLGANKNQELVFGEFGIIPLKDHKDFHVSFNVVKPFNGSGYDLENYFREKQEETDESILYGLCVYFDCSPSELAVKQAEDCQDVRDVIDCSLYPERCYVDGETWYFEAVSSGSLDKNSLEVYTGKDIYNRLLALSERYNFKTVGSDIVVQVENLAKMCEEIQEHEEEWITNYIRENMAE